MKRAIVAAILGTVLINHMPAATAELMGRTDEGSTLVLDYVAMEYEVYPSYGKTLGFTFTLLEPHARSVDARVNQKSCANGRYFISQEDGSDRKIQATSPAAKKMLGKVCNVLNGKSQVSYGSSGEQLYVPVSR